MSGRGRGAAALLAVGVLLAGCTPGGASSPTPTATPTTRPFTVLTSQPIGSVDPVAATTETDATLVLNAFSRLMTVQPDTGALKPGLATDCLFKTETVVECTLPADVTFSNGDVLTSADVKFSIERAYRLGSAGTSAGLLDALDTVEAPDARTVRFNLKFPDAQFGFALATPAASIVDAKVYDPDQVRGLDQPLVGSGAFTVSAIDASHAVLDRRVASTGEGAVNALEIRVVADSAAAEGAIKDGTADVVWGALDAAAVQRLTTEISGSKDHTTAKGFTRISLPTVRQQQLRWTPGSEYRLDATLRDAVAVALQADRTATSLVPLGMSGHVDSFPVGGTPAVTRPDGARLRLTLGYSSKSPGLADLARTVRDRVENLVGVSLQLIPDSEATDLVLVDTQVWLNTPLGWLQPYLQEPLPGSAAKLAELDRLVRSTTDTGAKDAALAEIQKQAAVDNTVLPMAQTDGVLFVGPGVRVPTETFGPGWRLVLSGVSRA